MPASPEIRHTYRQIGLPEIRRNIKAHYLRAAFGHIGIAAEIAVDLQRKEGDSQNDIDSVILPVFVEDRIHVDGEPVGDHHLKEKSP